MEYPCPLSINKALLSQEKYFREYLCENENIFENILGYCSRAQVLSNYAKNQKPEFKNLMLQSL